MAPKQQSLEWAIDFLLHHSDGDLFPKILELDAIAKDKAHFVALVGAADLSKLHPGSCRRFIVPKDEFAYRQATQLDPQDSIILTALIHEFGSLIEARRRPTRQVFSYRFKPDLSEGLYSTKTVWNDFWTVAARMSQSSKFVLYCDIADFYNQIYHHAVENELIAAGLPNQATKWLIELLKSTTQGVSRGVPIGPHAIHLVAEASLIPIDNSLHHAGMKFIRYADDILIFFRSEQDARAALSLVATTLDKQQRLTLQRHKTKIYEPGPFYQLCMEMIEDRPINAEEKSLLDLIRRYSGGDPYRTISLAQVTSADWASISKDAITRIINDYVNTSPIDYIRLRWFYRRLAQIGHPGAIEVSLANLNRLGPCFANICFYLGSIQSIDPKEWKKIGSSLLALLRSYPVKTSEYFRLLIVSLFSRNQHINHFTRLRNLYAGADPFIRREIILAAKINGATDWIRELREDYPAMDAWQQRAMLFAASGLARDEKKYFINRQAQQRPFEAALAKWAKDQ